jgi:serine/threonine protein kinase
LKLQWAQQKALLTCMRTEECLEWVLHCDVKLQNILLHYDYQPKVADFGLSKRRNREELDISSFSKMRGTRGYMAPSWLYNLPITSKVDVYSYGIVVLEMVTRKSPTSMHSSDSEGAGEHMRVVKLVKEKMMSNIGSSSTANESWIEELIDPSQRVAGK